MVKVARLGAVAAAAYLSGAVFFFFIVVAPLIDPLPLGAAALVVSMLLSLLALVFRPSWALALFSVTALIAASLHGYARTPALAVMPAAVSARLSQQPGVALVTGSTRGIGFAVAKRLASLGWTVFIHGRSKQQIDAAAASINAVYSGRALAVSVGADLANFSSITAFCNAVLRDPHSSKLSLLINNAGIVRTDPIGLTVDGFDRMMQVNCVAGALIERLLLKGKCPLTRVVHVSSLSSSGATGNVTIAGDLRLSLENKFGDELYGRTKQCQIAWARRHNAPVLSVSVHPGGCGSDMPEEGFSAEFPPPAMPDWLWRSFVRPMTLKTLKSTWFEVGWCAENVVYAAGIAPVAAGTYFGRFREMPLLLRAPLHGDNVFVERISKSIAQAVE